MHKKTRMECSKDARRVLARNGVDLTECKYNVSGSEVHLSGWLCKTTGAEFTGLQVESLVMDLLRSMHGYTIQGEMENWKFNSQQIRYLADRVVPETMSKEEADDIAAYDDYKLGN